MKKLVQASEVVVDYGLGDESEAVYLDWFIQQFNEQTAELIKMTNEHHTELYQMHGRLNILYSRLNDLEKRIAI